MHKSNGAQLVKQLHLPAFLLVPVFVRSAFAELFQDVNVPVRLDEGQPPPLGFGFDLLHLRHELPSLGREQHFIAVRGQQRIDVGFARQLQRPAAAGSCALIRRQLLELGAKHFFSAQCLGELSPALVALGQPQSQQRF
jgi:hypothetical protein